MGRADSSIGGKPREDGDKEPYEPPKLEALGTMQELTGQFSFFKLDLSGLGPASSDRRLKQDIAVVDSREVLATAVELPLER